MKDIKKLKKKRLIKLIPNDIKEVFKNKPGIRYKFYKNGDMLIYANIFTLIGDLYKLLINKCKKNVPK